MKTTINILPEDYADLEGENEILKDLYAAKDAVMRRYNYDDDRQFPDWEKTKDKWERLGFKFILPPSASTKPPAPADIFTPSVRWNVRHITIVTTSGLSEPAAAAHVRRPLHTRVTTKSPGKALASHEGHLLHVAAVRPHKPRKERETVLA